MPTQQDVPAIEGALSQHGAGSDVDPARVIADDDAAALLQTALQVQPLALVRQTLTDSGNAVFRADLPGERSVVLRVSPRRAFFAHTRHNLNVLKALDLPVPTVLAAGATASNGSFVVLNWIPGRDLMFELDGMRTDQMTRVAEAITEYQQRVASLPESRGFGWAPIGGHAAHARWSEMFGMPVESPLGDDATALQQLRHRLRAVRRQIEPYFASRRPICFLDDLTIKNVLVENGELQGLIDLDVVCYGDPLLSVGTTLARVAADVGEAGRFYGDALVRCRHPSADAYRAIHFYAALWAIGFLAAADRLGDAARARALEPIVDALLREAEAA
jgi:aminoglycoside phosphotransferase (APT) family kinase protein